MRVATPSRPAPLLPPLEGNISYAPESADPLATYALTGDTQPVHDPSIIRQGSTYYAFTTDVLGLPASNYLPIRCSQDKVSWTACGSIFPNAMPAWVVAKVPGIVGLWAPDISYFNGLYHVYYAGSTLGSQQSVIGLVTNTTLDPTDPAYQVGGSGRGPRVQSWRRLQRHRPQHPHRHRRQRLDDLRQLLVRHQAAPDRSRHRACCSPHNTTRYNLATRPGVPEDPIEGSSLVHHGNYYYLFVSVDFCCNQNIATDDYKEAVGRSTSPHGPFRRRRRHLMMNGGGTVLLQSDGTWNAPGGGTAYLDPTNGDSLIVFHALNMTQNGALYLWLKNLEWVNDWPTIGD